MNLLKYETSPYLLQHAANPVHWQPWSEAAFEQARSENKPVLLSIGYSSCHWCHVMEHESFEDEEVASIMNHAFVNIKLDREEYPDVDHMYMDAVQAMTGSGGWPLNVFLTPEKKPFYGGTYFPPVRAFNRASWKEVLINVSQYFTQNRSEVEQQAHQLMTHLQSAGALPKLKNDFASTDEKSKEDIDREIFEKIMAQADQIEGGFGNAPKFPSTFSIRFLLDYYSLYHEEKALRQACLSLDKMAMGGIYDQLGGGFSRYSTDKYWIAPHFEKMLYDNALLLEVYSIAYSHTHNQLYRQIVQETIAWLEREMRHEDGGFYSAQDADSEGVEGKYYTWSYTELKELLQDDFELYKTFYQLAAEGNWEHTNILYTTAAQMQMTDVGALAKIRQINTRLRLHRATRVKPLTDDKIILGWNALMNKALSLASLIFDEDHYLQLALSNMQFIRANMKNESHLYYHTHKDGVNKIPAYLDDLAYLSDALIQLHIASAGAEYLHLAKEIVQYASLHFTAETGALFCYTNRSFQQVDINKTETYDGAVPSSNSVLCRVLHHLGIAFGEASWLRLHNQMLAEMQVYFTTYPSSFAIWADLFLNKSDTAAEITIAGPDAKEIVRQFYTKRYLSHVTYTVVNTYEENIAELRGKYAEGETRIYICRNQSCLEPFTSIDEAMTVIY